MKFAFKVVSLVLMRQSYEWAKLAFCLHGPFNVSSINRFFLLVIIGLLHVKATYFYKPLSSHNQAYTARPVHWQSCWTVTSVTWLITCQPGRCSIYRGAILNLYISRSYHLQFGSTSVAVVWQFRINCAEAKFYCTWP